MTFSSTHPSALPLYAGFGLSAWWPLLYLSGDPSRVPQLSDLTVAGSSADGAAWLEQYWAGGGPVCRLHSVVGSAGW